MSLLPQFGFMELLVIAAVLLIVVGPKELPGLMKSCGRFMARARQMASEFTVAFEQMARDAEIDEMRQEMEALKRDNALTDLKREVTDGIAPITEEALALQSGATDFDKPKAGNKETGGAQADLTGTTGADEGTSAKQVSAKARDADATATADNENNSQASPPW